MEPKRVDNFFRQVLPNGMTIVFEKRNLPLITICVGVKLGAGHEPEKLKGISHFMEHAVFKATKTRKKEEMMRLIEKAGGTINAYTGEEETVFWAKLPSSKFELGLDILADMVMNPLFDRKDLAMEKKVILEEINLYTDSPEAYPQLKVKDMLYEKPFGMFIAGTQESMSRIKRADLLKYHNIYYKPSNMVVSIVGDANVDAIWNLCKKKFKKQAQEQIQQSPITANPGTFGEVFEKRKNISQANLALAFHIPSLSSPQRYAVEIANTILGAGQSSYLHEEIREKKGWAYTVRSSLDIGKDYGYCLIYAGIEKTKVHKTKEIILKQIKRLQNITPKELEETKEQLVGNYETSSESCASTAEALLKEQILGDAKNHYKYLDNIYKVKLEDVQKVFDIKNYGFIALIPEDVAEKK